MDQDRKSHWENIYSTKQSEEVSWYQPVPETSLEFIHETNLPKHARIIDVGGGDSLLVDHLLEAGYTNVTVLDISEKALERAKARLGTKANLVNWIVSDVTNFQPDQAFDLWHDRAVFHFLTNENDIETYRKLLQTGITPGGKLILGTFSTNGPIKCSGIPIQQYDETSMRQLLEEGFDHLQFAFVNHPTPFNTVQEFIFCRAERK